VLLAVEAVHQVEEDLGFEVGQLELVDVVPEEVVRPAPGCRGDHGGYKILVEFGTPQLVHGELLMYIGRISCLILSRSSGSAPMPVVPSTSDKMQYFD